MINELYHHLFYLFSEALRVFQLHVAPMTLDYSIMLLSVCVCVRSVSVFQRFDSALRAHRPVTDLIDDVVEVLNG